MAEESTNIESSPSSQLRSSQLPASQQSYQPSQTLSLLIESPISRRTRRSDVNIPHNDSIEDLLQQVPEQISPSSVHSLRDDPAMSPPPTKPKPSQPALSSPISLKSGAPGTQRSAQKSQPIADGQTFDIIAHLQGSSSHVLLTLHTNMTMQTLRQNLWDALHDAEDPNVDVGNWPPERAIDKIVVVWSNGVGNGPGQIALWQKNVVHTLRMIGEKGGVGYSLNVVLKD